MGAMKVCTEPSGAAGVRMIPAGAVQLKVRTPLEGSTALAVSVTSAPPTTLLAGDELAETTGGVPGGGTTIGTSTVAGAEAGVNASPPQSAGTPGSAVLLLRGYEASLGFVGVQDRYDRITRIDDLRPGKRTGRRSAGRSSRVTVTPANGGFGADVKTGRATETKVPGVHVNGGSVSSGNGFSWMEFWLG